VPLPYGTQWWFRGVCFFLVSLQQRLASTLKTHWDEAASRDCYRQLSLLFTVSFFLPSSWDGFFVQFQGLLFPVREALQIGSVAPGVDSPPFFVLPPSLATVFVVSASRWAAHFMFRPSKSTCFHCVGSQGLSFSLFFSPSVVMSA